MIRRDFIRSCLALMVPPLMPPGRGAWGLGGGTTTETGAWNRALTPEELAFLHDAGPGLTYTEVRLPGLLDGLVSWHEPRDGEMACVYDFYRDGPWPGDPGRRPTA